VPLDSRDGVDDDAVHLPPPLETLTKMARRVRTITSSR
jgi:hypothetical protein